MSVLGVLAVGVGVVLGSLAMNAIADHVADETGSEGLGITAGLAWCAVCAMGLAALVGVLVA